MSHLKSRPHRVERRHGDARSHAERRRPGGHAATSEPTLPALRAPASRGALAPPAKPKIVHFIPTLEQGGAERMLVEITNCDEVHDHVVVTLIGSGQFFASRIRGSVISLGASSKALSLLAVPITVVRAVLLLGALRPERTVGWLYYGCPFACLGKLFGSRVLWSLHATDLQGARRHRLTRLARDVCGLLSRTRCVDLVQYCSDASRASHEGHGFSRRKSIVVRNAVDTDIFTPQESESRALARARFVAEPEHAAVAWIGCVARFDAQKDHENLFQALQLLKRRGYKFRCAFAGRNCVRENAAFAGLIARYDCADVAIPLGAIANVAELYRALDVLVLSSSYGEAMPLVLLEAIASGCPVVATDIGSNREIVGAFGAIVPVRSPEALADAIGRALAAPVTPLWKAQAHAYISEHYGKSRLLHGWHELIARLQTVGGGRDRQPQGWQGLP